MKEVLSRGLVLSCVSVVVVNWIVVVFGLIHYLILS
jgi:type IV secretory pathway TrbD component